MFSTIYTTEHLPKDGKSQIRNQRVFQEEKTK